MQGRKPDPTGKVIPMKGDVVLPEPEPFDWMTELAKDVWRDLAPDLTRMARLKPHFHHQFASYCEAVSNFIKATNELALNGMWYETRGRNGVQQKHTSAWRAQDAAANQMRRDSALFGLTPVDESRIGDDGQGDLFEKVLAQLKGGKSASA